MFSKSILLALLLFFARLLLRCFLLLCLLLSFSPFCSILHRCCCLLSHPIHRPPHCLPAVDPAQAPNFVYKECACGLIRPSLLLLFFCPAAVPLSSFLLLSFFSVPTADAALPPPQVQHLRGLPRLHRRCSEQQRVRGVPLPELQLHHGASVVVPPCALLYQSPSSYTPRHTLKKHAW